MPCSHKEKASSGALRHKLEAVGVKAPSGTQAHHIVGGAYQDGKNTRSLLAKHDIDVNSAMNGVFLPGCKPSNAIGTIHCGKHTQAYEKYVWDILQGKHTKADIINALSDIRIELLQGTLRLNAR